MATDTWMDSNDNWTTSADWSGGVPRSSSDVAINPGGSPQVTSSWGTIDSFTNGGTLDFDSAGVNRVIAGGINQGIINIDARCGQGGSTLRITGQGGSFTNYGTIVVGNSASAGNSELATTSQAFYIENEGVIDLLGSSGGNATISAATLLQNDGAIYATADQFTDKGGLSGIGTTYLQDGSKMEIKGSVSSSATISFDSGTGSSADHLNLELAELFSGAIDDFVGKGDSVHAADFAYASAAIGYHQNGADACTITLASGGNSATINFTGAVYTSSDFSFSAATDGGVKITHT
jgi:hypothetical protein